MSIAVALATRYLLVVLFFPFSAMDKIINFKGAVAQAKEAVSADSLAVALILTGLAVEIFMPVAVLTGIADRLAAFILAGYCGVTALLWKQWWQPGDFWQSGESKGRNLFWDFLKNFSLAGGFLLLAFGLHAGDLSFFLSHPLDHPIHTCMGRIDSDGVSGRADRCYLILPGQRRIAPSIHVPTVAISYSRSLLTYS